MKKFKKNFNALKLSGFGLVLVLALSLTSVSFAGSLTPASGAPSPTFYTLEDIYIRLTTNTAATEGDHSLSTTTSPAPTFYTLKQIYENIPTLDPAKILSGTTYMGVAGTASAGADLSSMYNGSCTDANACPGSEFPGGSQANGGVEDCQWTTSGNMCESPPSDRFETDWTLCNLGNDYCGTGDEGANAKDEATGLVWSYPCSGSGCTAWDTADSATLTAGCEPSGNCAYYDTDTYYTWDNSGTDNGGKTASALCSSNAGWSLPHQKQLMQAYIDGAYGNLEPEGVSRSYWSSTTNSGYAAYAWVVHLSDGYTYYGTKSNPAGAVRCVRE